MSKTALQRQGPPTKPSSDRSRALFNEFSRFWDLETEPAERRKLLLSLFEQIWAQSGQIVAVQPHDDFLPYFQAIQHGAAPGGAEGGSGEGPSLRRAHAVLRDGGLLDPLTIQQLQSRAAKDAKGRSQQHACHAEYLEWREQAARKLARQAGPLGRLTHRPEAYYTQLDTEKLRVCRTCTELIYPSAQEAEAHGSPEAAACHYCHERHNSRPFKPAATAATESETYR